MALENPDFHSQLWQVDQGLPHNIVQAITQTRDGYLWVGTREGLARFDGERFQKVDLVSNSFPPSVLCLLESGDETLWVGTLGSGVFRVRGGQVERCKLPDGTQDFDAYQIQQAGDGSIWIGSAFELLRWSDGKLVRRATYHNMQQAFCTDREKHVWLLDGALKQMDADTATNYPLRSGFLPHGARSICCDGDGAFWLGLDVQTGKSLIQLKDGVATGFHKGDGPAGVISGILRDSSGELWIGSYSGLSRFKEGEFIEMRAANEPAYRIYAIYEDRERNLWVGSEEGLERLTPKRFKSISTQNGLTLPKVVAVTPSHDGSVWISLWGGGLNHWVDGKVSALNSASGLSSDVIMAITEGRDGSLWAGTDHGGDLNRILAGQITIYGQKQGFSISRTTATTALHEDERGVLWIGTRDSLQCWDGKQFTRCAEMEHRKINALCGGAGGVVWIGADDGLVRWRNNRFENVTLGIARPRAPILSLYEDQQRVLWVGTRGYGLLSQKGGTTSAFTTSQGLFSDSIYSILEDGHENLWLSSSRGICRLSKRELETAAGLNRTKINCLGYGKADGIPISGQYQDVTQPSACKSTDGRLWFRTTQGVVVVDPEKIVTNRRIPPLVIQEILADGKPLDQTHLSGKGGGPIKVQPGRGELEIHYAALSFSAPEKNRFRYKLGGMDLDWVEAGTRRVALYNNLRPGQYSFQVIACNNDGVWNDIGASAAIVLEPHFWQTDWFLTVLAVGAVGSVGGTARFVTRRRMQRKLARLEQQNALEKERSRIARDMHDELGAKLTRISFQGAMARRHLSNPAEAEKQIVSMSETARGLVLSLDQIVWAVDPKNDTLESLATYVCRYASDFVENSPLRCEFVIPTQLPERRLSTEVRHNVFLSVKECLNNVLKHAGATQLILTIRVRDDEFEVCVADNGRGIPSENPDRAEKFKRTGHGLANLRERMAAIGGRFELNSDPGTGTEIRLVVPFSD
jgi:signal transduction histidine kinase/ligand-binding sensor domain-containing protein